MEHAQGVQEYFIGRKSKVSVLRHFNTHGVSIFLGGDVTNSKPKS